MLEVFGLIEGDGLERSPFDMKSPKCNNQKDALLEQRQYFRLGIQYSLPFPGSVFPVFRSHVRAPAARHLSDTTELSTLEIVSGRQHAEGGGMKLTSRSRRE